jgi:16S rRNA (cytidine1402-2'-O)-methyltransferase
MPAISDPGEELVLQCHLAGVTVASVPGPSALITALAISGMPSGRFTFEGFLSMNKKNRRDHLEQLTNEPRTMIFYESPYRVVKTLTQFAEFFGEDREVSVSRELTKKFEQTVRGSVADVLAHFQENEPKGEFVIVLAGCPKDKQKED